MIKLKNSILILLLLVIMSCGTNRIRYTYIPENKQSNTVTEKTLLLYLYSEKDLNKSVDIVTNTGEKIYSIKSFSKDKSEYKELKLPVSARSITVTFNKKRNNIEINPNYQYLYFEFKGKDFIEIVYSDEKPEFID